MTDRTAECRTNNTNDKNKMERKQIENNKEGFTPVQIRSGPPIIEPATSRHYDGDIISHALWMEKQGYKRSTILSAVSSLRGIAKQTNLLEPEQVKRYLGSAMLVDRRKEALTARMQSNAMQRRG